MVENINVLEFLGVKLKLRCENYRFWKVLIKIIISKQKQNRRKVKKKSKRKGKKNQKKIDLGE